jgi:hypothetical protein
VQTPVGKAKTVNFSNDALAVSSVAKYPPVGLASSVTTNANITPLLMAPVHVLQLTGADPEKPSSIDVAAQAQMTGWTPAKRANPINVSFNMTTTLVANPNSK